MKRILPILILLIMSVFTILPLGTPGYFPMHDDTQVSRVIEMGNALKEGQIPVRWVPDLGYGYGYPIFNFYGPLPYYVGGMLYALGFPAVEATKVMFAIGVIAPAFVLFAVMSASAGWPVGLLSSILYLFAPYHAVQVYVRGAVGEYWILIFWPLIFHAFIHWKHEKQRYRQVLIGSIGIGGAVVSHTLLGYVTIVFVVFGYISYWILRMIQRRLVVIEVLWQGTMILLGLGVSAFFWLPAVFEMGFTAVSGQVSATAYYLDHFVCVGQLWGSLWGYGGSSVGCVDGISFMIGKLHVLIAGLSAVLWAYIRPKEERTVWITGAVLAGVGIFFATSYSKIIWGIIPAFSYIQYPWRFLAVTGFGIAIMGGLLPLAISKKGYGRMIMAVVISLGVVFMNAKWFVPQYTYQKESAEFESIADLRWRASKISDEYLPAAFIRPDKASGAVFDTIDHMGLALNVVHMAKTATRVQFIVNATTSATIGLHIAYFPGWHFFVNQKEVQPQIDNGLPRLSIGEGKSEILAEFTDTPVRILSNSVSLLSMLGIGWIYYGKQNKTKC